MGNNDVTRLVYEGAVALQAGRREEAQTLLMEAIRQDEHNEQAWLWLSGAVEDPGDQQVALENVLELNPNNQAAKDGLAWLQSQQKRAPRPHPVMYVPPQEWVEPPPMDPDEVIELACWQCQASLYSVAQFCFQCHAPVHACNNCMFLPEPRCKELQDLTSTLAQAAINRCPWWRPAAF